MENEKRKKIIILTIIFGAATLIIMTVMNLKLIPEIERSTNSIRCFDMNSLGYSYEQAKQFVSLLSNESRNLYLHVQLPLDFVYPIVYSVFFCLVFHLILTGKKYFYLFPVALAVFDYIENIFTVIMLTADSFSKTLAAFASTATIIKSFLMIVSISIILISLILRFSQRKRSEKDND